MTDFLNKNKKELKLLADYSYTDKYEANRLFANKIYWEDDKLYSTCGAAMLYMAAENNPDGFTLMEVNKGKITVVTDQKEIEKQKEAGLYKRIIDRFSTYDFSFDFVWDKDLPLPSKLASSRANRGKDNMYFNFEINELEIDFNAFEENKVIATYEDLFQNMEGEKPDRRLCIKYWHLFELLKAGKENKVHCEIGNIRFLGDKSYYIRMTTGKYTCVVIAN